MSNGKSAKVIGEARHYSFVQLDVFTSRPLEGNALAVFTDARGLSDAEMQAVARETHLSETTFVFPRAPKVERDHGVRVRIFTTEEELPFAGHPTLGTAFALRGPDRRAAGGGAMRARSGASPATATAVSRRATSASSKILLIGSPSPASLANVKESRTLPLLAFPGCSIG